MRLGILGGTFNPIHEGHMQMARQAKEILSLDFVYLMVSSDPPHKTVAGDISCADRFRMAELAAADSDRILACDLELLRDGKSYTYETLEELKKKIPDAELFLIIGSDSLHDFLSWKCPERILAVASLAVVPRTGQSEKDAADALAIEAKYGCKVTLLQCAVPAVSSTMIREAVRKLRYIGKYVCPDVEEYIYAHGFYLEDCLRRKLFLLRKSLPEKRFKHSVGVMMQAARLSEEWGCNTEKTLIASMLHDCAKYLSPEEMERYSDDDTGIELVQHAFAGASYARDRYGIEDADILRAIRLHCTGDENMHLLDKIVYLADVTERNRDFPGVEAYRYALNNGPDEAMIKVLRGTLNNIKSNRANVHPATEKALKDIEQKIQNERKMVMEKERVLDICKVLYDKKAKDIVALHVAEKTIIADWFVIASGNVPAQTKMLADELEEKAYAMGLELRRKEGYAEGQWIVLDYGDLLVHLFVPEERKHYNMERLWDEDGNAIRYEPDED